MTTPPGETLLEMQRALRAGRYPDPDLQGRFLALNEDDLRSFTSLPRVLQSRDLLGNLILADSYAGDLMDPMTGSAVAHAYAHLSRVLPPLETDSPLPVAHAAPVVPLYGEQTRQGEFADENGSGRLLSVMMEPQGDVYFTLREQASTPSGSVRMVSSGSRRPRVLCAARHLALMIREEEEIWTRSP